MKSNNLIGELLDASKNTDRAIEVCQSHIMVYLTNDARAVIKMPTVGRAAARAQTMRSVGTRLKGKRGRIRGNLMGKRVDYSSRSVIGPDSRIDVDELGVPETIALHQTRLVRVAQFNLRALRDAVLCGYGSKGGASFVVDDRGERRTLKCMTPEQRRELANQLEIGWSVARHLRDGDLVLFNRQPSLHKFSLMAHRIRILPGRSFRLSPQVIHYSLHTYQSILPHVLTTYVLKTLKPTTIHTTRSPPLIMPTSTEMR